MAPIRASVRALASGGFQVNPAAFCLKLAQGGDVTEGGGGVGSRINEVDCPLFGPCALRKCVRMQRDPSPWPSAS